MENKDLKFIKKFYGEQMMHLCREFFPTILDEEGRLTKIMQDNFEPTRALYEELVKQNKTGEFRNYIVSIFNGKTNTTNVETKLTPNELLEQAGYILYPECKTEEEIQKFKKYYAPGEEICTFKGNRLDTCRVWFAVKKNVDEIKRENFKNPEREDEYGTSVISIQFSKLGGWLSIKNRYNHIVKNPDCTFSNRLDNIIPTLDYSFRKYFNLPQTVNIDNSTLRLNNFVMARDNKRYHVNAKIDNFCFCENNIVLSDGLVTQFDKDRDILMDNILVDKKRKSIEVLSELFDYGDSCLDGIGRIEKIDEKPKERGEKDVAIIDEKGKKIIFTINRYNQIIGYTNDYLTEVKDNFLRYNKYVKSVSLSNVLTVGDNFLENANNIENIHIPNVKKDCGKTRNGRFVNENLEDEQNVF